MTYVKTAETQRTDYAAMLDEAHAAGMAALDRVTPTPMVVYEADGLTDEPKPGGKSWYVPQGPCGFAWVNLYPATTPFARWLKKHRFGSRDAGGRWGKGYPQGYQFWVHVGGQSIELKEAYARAYAEVLRAGGFNAYSGSRLD